MDIGDNWIRNHINLVGNAIVCFNTIVDIIIHTYIVL